MFAAYLWKEWREQKRLLIILAVAIPVIHVAGWWLLEPAGIWVDRHPIAAFAPAVLTLMLVLCLFAFDTVAREKERRTLDFLCRLPGDTKNPFWAKTLLLTCVIVFFWTAAPLTLLFVDVELSAMHVSATELFIELGVLLLLVLALSFWGVAVSCWLPKGSMALPATFLITGAAWIPFMVMWIPTWIFYGLSPQFRDFIGYNLQPFPFPVEFAVILLLFLPLASMAGAWISFSGFKNGGRCIRSSLVGVPVFLLCVLSLCGWKVIRHDAWCAARPHSGDLWISGAIIGKGGDYAFIDTYSRGVQNSIIYELNTGEWSEPQESPRRFDIFDESPDGEYRLITPGMYLQDCPEYVALYMEDQSTRVWNGMTGEFAFDVVDRPLRRIPPHINIEHENRRIWNKLAKDREELKGTTYPNFIHEKLWLVRAPDDASMPDEHGTWRWTLYHVEDRQFSPAPCSEYPYYVSTYQSITNRWKGETSALHCHPDYNRKMAYMITFMLPGEHHWLVHWKENENNVLRVWYPDTNTYYPPPLLEGFDSISVPHNVDWTAVYSGERGDTVLIHRESLRMYRVPDLRVYYIFRTPEGNAVLQGCNAQNSKDRRIVHLNRWTGEMSYIQRPIRPMESFRIVGIPDDKTVYGLFDGDGYPRQRLVKIDFSKRSFEIVFPAEE